MRDKRRYIKRKFKRDIDLQDWSLMYRNIGANGIFHKFFEIFQNVLNSHAQSEKRKGTQKWLSIQLLSVVSIEMAVSSLLNEKHRVFIDWKWILIKSPLTVTKY